MTKQQNTDGKFWAYRTVATLPDGSGKYRTSIVRFSDIYDWSDAGLAEAMGRERLPTALVGPLTRAEWDALGAREARMGYCETSDLTAPVTLQEWVWGL